MSVSLQNDRALLEFQSPTAAVIADRVPLGGRITIWVVAAAILSSIGVMGFYPVDRVVAVPGKVVARVPNTVIQPLETAIVRQIDVQEGQVVHAGDRLAMLDPTFATADQGSADAQVTSLQAGTLSLILGSKFTGLSGSQPASKGPSLATLNTNNFQGISANQNICNDSAAFDGPDSPVTAGG